MEQTAIFGSMESPADRTPVQDQHWFSLFTENQKYPPSLLTPTKG